MCEMSTIILVISIALLNYLEEVTGRIQTWPSQEQLQAEWPAVQRFFQYLVL